MITHRILRAGEVRTKGDEVRHLNVAKVKWKDASFGHEFAENEWPKLGPWEPIQLLNHQILPSDLMIAEFRRPVEVAVD